MLRRRLHRVFPVFFTYVVFQIVAFALTFPFREERFYTIFYYSTGQPRRLAWFLVLK